MLGWPGHGVTQLNKPADASQWIWDIVGLGQCCPVTRIPMSGPEDGERVSRKKQTYCCPVLSQERSQLRGSMEDSCAVRRPDSSRAERRPDLCLSEASHIWSSSLLVYLYPGHGGSVSLTVYFSFIVQNLVG